MTKQKLKIRVPMPAQPPAVRISNFKEVALGYTAEQAMAEAGRCLQCKNPLCVPGCPVEVEIKEFIKCVADGELDEAYRIIRKTNSLPAVCGRVCPQETQCEGACILARGGQPIAIGRLERFVADNYIAKNPCARMTGEDGACCPAAGSGPKFACIGSGPASLTCAGHLAARGAKVTVFEALHEPGGVLVYGIPEFRLPKWIVAEELGALKSLGVEFRLNWVGGRTFTIQELFSEGYAAVFIGVGAGLPNFLGIPGENLIGVFSANEYLTRINLGRAFDFPNFDTPSFRGRKVTVFGAGNVAMDAARTALRMGSESVTVVYRRTRAEIPARLEELEHAEEEGVKFKLLSAPLRFLGNEENRLTGVELEEMELTEPGPDGRRGVRRIPGSNHTLETDMAIIAVGTRSNPVLLKSTEGLRLTSKGYIEVSELLETSLPNVFAGGDIVTGSATVIEAMGAGRLAAMEMARRFL
ncbi:MAG: NADPH-dependent glutamate synthase [Desulfovibrionaceae bacterium]|nr:NADPH-dependent glutamate synthase [Desulfovibrionaceae bacterium]